MQLAPSSSTKHLTILCCLAASAQVTDGFVAPTTSTSVSQPASPLATTTITTGVTSSLFANSNTIHNNNNRIPTTMLSSATSFSSSAASAATSMAATAFLNPRRRDLPATPPFAAAKNSRRSSTALNLAVGRVPSGGGAVGGRFATTAVRSTALPPRSSSSSSLFSSASGQAPECPFTQFMASFGAIWGSLGVVYVLAKGISRALPFALEPLYESSSLVLSPLQWSMYALSCLFFAYAEGYKGFHRKFSPLVVKRSFTLVIGTPQGNNPLNYLFAPLYSMGLWGATKKRLRVSWGLNLGIVTIVALVKRLPPAPRCIIDAGVVLGLTIGSASILYHFFASLWTGNLPDVDACLPPRKSD